MGARACVRACDDERPNLPARWACWWLLQTLQRKTATHNYNAAPCWRSATRSPSSASVGLRGHSTTLRHNVPMKTFTSISGLFHGAHERGSRVFCLLTLTFAGPIKSNLSFYKKSGWGDLMRLCRCARLHHHNDCCTTVAPVCTTPTFWRIAAIDYLGAELQPGGAAKQQESEVTLFEVYFSTRVKCLHKTAVIIEETNNSHNIINNT